MQQGPYNQNQFDYDSFDSPQKRGILEKVFGAGIAAKLRSPMFATVALIAVAGVFAAVIAGSYSSAQKEEQVPIVRADAERFKTEPDAPGGMNVPYQDSTVFDTMRQASNQGVGDLPPIENLLADAQDPPQPVSKAQAIENAPITTAAANLPRIITPTEVKTPELDQSGLDAPDAIAPSEEESAQAPGTPEAAPKPMSEIAIKQEIEKIPPQELSKQAAAKSAKPATMNAAGDSPETLEFVRSVLEKKDSQAKAGTSSDLTPMPTETASAQPIAAPPVAVEKIEPAAGAAAPATASPSGYFVQVASVPSEAGAAGEWAKLQKNHPGLSGKQYRLQPASVEGRGTFYRIQAGPLSKDAATALCDSIKAQKPGGCLVVR